MYRALCLDDPMKLEKMRHRAMDDAVMEGWILKACRVSNPCFSG